MTVSVTVEGDAGGNVTVTLMVSAAAAALLTTVVVAAMVLVTVCIAPTPLALDPLLLPSTLTTSYRLFKLGALF